MNILVTGGSGFLGTHLCHRLGADNFSRRVNLDLLNLQDVHKAEEYDVVIHLAAQLDKSPDSAEEVFLNNVEGTVNLLRTIRENAVFIFASTKDVYGRFADGFDEVPETCQTLYSGQSALEWSKLIAEKYVTYYAHQNNFRSCIFRLSTIVAPDSPGNTPNFITHYAKKLQNGQKIRLPANGRPVRDILHVNELSAACSAFAESVIRHGIYNLGGGRKLSMSLGEIVTKMGEISGLTPDIDEANPLSTPVPFNYVSDLTLVKTELDWNPEMDVEDSLGSLFTRSEAEEVVK